MATATKEQPEASESVAANAATANDRRAANKPERESWAMYRLVESDDASDVERREALGTLPIEADYERHIKRNYGAGRFRIEHRRNGRFVSVTEFNVQPQASIIAVNDNLEDYESDEPQTVDLPEDFDERIARIVVATLDARDRAERTRAAQTSPMSQADSIGTLADTVRALKELQQTIAPPPQVLQPVPQTDQFQAFVQMFEQFTAIQERVNPPSITSNGSTGIVGQVASLIDAFGKHAPKLIPLIGVMNAQGNEPQANRTAQTVQTRPSTKVTATENPKPAAQVEPEVSNEETSEKPPLLALLHSIIAELAKDSHVEETAAGVCEFMEQHPDHSPFIENLSALPTEKLLQALVQIDPVGGAYYANLPHAEKWLDNLRDEVSDMLSDGEEASEETEQVA